jgi:prepilin-type processing-associated H-X9-DG protein
MVGEGKSGPPRHVSTGNALSSAIWCGMSGTYNVPTIGTYIWLDNVMWPTGGHPSWSRDYVDEAFNSNHNGSVNFVFADGSVQSLSSRIDPALRAQLGIRNDSLPLTSP